MPAAAALSRRSTRGATDTVEHDAHVPVAEGVTDPFGPSRLEVVDGDARPEGTGAGHLVAPTGEADDHRLDVPCSLDEQAAESSRRGRHHHDVVGGQCRDVEHPHCRPAGADRRDGHLDVEVVGDVVECGHRRDRALRVAAVGLPEVGDDAAARPARVRAGPECVDDSGGLPSGDHRQVRQGEVATLDAAANDGVDEVHAAGLHGDADLPGCWLRVGDLLVAEVLWGPNSCWTIACMRWLRWVGSATTLWPGADGSPVRGRTSPASQVRFGLRRVLAIERMFV